MKPGCLVDFAVTTEGDVVIHKVGAAQPGHQPDRFDASRGKADLKWSTDELMSLLRR